VQLLLVQYSEQTKLDPSSRLLASMRMRLHVFLGHCGISWNAVQGKHTVVHTVDKHKDSKSPESCLLPRNNWSCTVLAYDIYHQSCPSICRALATVAHGSVCRHHPNILPLKHNPPVRGSAGSLSRDPLVSCRTNINKSMTLIQPLFY
jgi:hypothetical protein